MPSNSGKAIDRIRKTYVNLATIATITSKITVPYRG